jgi:hypothetical protein
MGLLYLYLYLYFEKGAKEGNVELLPRQQKIGADFV